MPSPLIERLVEELDYPFLTESNFESFIQNEDTSVLFLTEQPKQVPESNDVAVILPELVKQFPVLTPAVVSTDYERTVRGRYNFHAYPALVFLKQGKFLGTITKVQNWDEYLTQISDILAKAPQPDPGIGTPVVFNPVTSSCGH